MVRKKSDSFANIFLEILACIVHNIHGNVIAVNRCCNPCKTCILVSAHNDLANGWSTYSRFVFIILRGFPSKLFYSKFGNCSIFSKLDQIIHFFFFLSRFSFTDTDHSQDSRGREGDHLLFQSTTSIRSRTFRHLFATLHVR